MNDQVEIINNLGQKEMVSKEHAEVLERIRKRTESMLVKKDSNGLPCYEEIPIWDFPEDMQEEMKGIGNRYKDIDDNTEKSVEMTNNLGKKFMVTEAFAKSYNDTMKECKATCQLLGIDFEELKKSAISNKLSGGKSDGMSLQDIADKHKVDIKEIKKEFAKGIDIEMEHTDDPKVATEIAKDHLWEFSNYYSELDKMEQSLKEEEKEK